MRFVYRAPEYRWVHHLEMEPGDIDLTDLSDAEFEKFWTDNNLNRQEKT